MTDFPSGVNSPNAPNYASPLLDFTPISQVPDAYYKGQDEQLKLKAKTAFRNGIPKTADGQNDYRAMTEKMIELGDYGTASSLGQLGIQQTGLDMMRTNPEANPGGTPPASGGQRSDAPAAAAKRQATAVPYDDRPARANNDGGFDAPGSTPKPAQVAQGGNTATDAPQPGVTTLPPPIKAEIDRRAASGDQETRERNLSRLMMYGPTKAIQDYAKLKLEAIQKERERTPEEKNVDPSRGNAYQRKTDIDVEGENRKLTPGAKDTSGGRRAGESVADAQARIKAEGSNQELTPGAKDTRPGGPGGKSVAQTQADIKVDEANRTMTPTAKDTKPLPGESPAQAAERIKVRGAIDTKAAEGSVANFEKDYRGLQVASQSAYNGIAKAKLGSQLTQQPGFYSGPLQPTTQMYQQFKSTFGNDPSSATPQEAFQKVVTDMLTEQVKALGQSGVGRVLMVEVQNMQKSIASLGISPATNRVLLDTVQRVYGQSQQLAEIARGIQSDQNIPPEQKQAALDQAADNFYKQNPIFKPEEVADPRLIGAPTVPAGVTTIPAFIAWAKVQNLPSGYPARLPNGKMKMVP